MDTAARPVIEGTLGEVVVGPVGFIPRSRVRAIGTFASDLTSWRGLKRALAGECTGAGSTLPAGGELRQAFGYAREEVLDRGIGHVVHEHVVDLPSDRAQRRLIRAAEYEFRRVSPQGLHGQLALHDREELAGSGRPPA